MKQVNYNRWLRLPLQAQAATAVGPTLNAHLCRGRQRPSQQHVSGVGRTQSSWQTSLTKNLLPGDLAEPFTGFTSLPLGSWTLDLAQEGG